MPAVRADEAISCDPALGCELLDPSVSGRHFGIIAVTVSTDDGTNMINHGCLKKVVRERGYGVSSS
jgi:hypothetical protein